MSPGQAIAIIASTYVLDLPESSIDAWVMWLRKIPENELADAVERACESSTRATGPTAPEIVAFWKSKAKTVESLDADMEFNRALQHCERYGAELFGGEPSLQLSAAGAFALRSVGWRSGVMGTKDENTHWLKKNWNTAYERFKEAERDGHALSQGETLKLLEMVKAELPQLPAATEDLNAIVGVGEIVSTLRSVAEEGNRKFHERPQMTDDRIADRLQHLKDDFALASRMAVEEKKVS
jgi:hypothetical protein